MRTTTSLKSLFVGVMATALVSVTSTFAGPGPHYWEARHQEAKGRTAKADNEGTLRCTDSKEVAITALRPSLHNGRGPMVRTQIATKRVCATCPVTATSGRVAPAGTRHTCGPECRVE